MKLGSLFGKKDLSDKKSALRKRLSEHRSALFPDGIYGQIAVGQKGDKLFVELPFNPNAVLSELAQITQSLSVEVDFHYAPTVSAKPIRPNIRTVIAVSSGKGGVGKSTVTANLAVALAQSGHKVGVLDADIYGPSMPIMFGLAGESVVTRDEKTMEPMAQHGVWLNSIGFLVPDEDAAIWRGPMASRALLQVLNETNWPDLDILLVDMPPGTGDIQLTMSEQVKCDGALVVTTPQNVALADAQKGIAMFNKVNTPVLGVVENMSQFTCSNCGEVHRLFGKGAGEFCAEKNHIPLLAQLPLLAEVREAGDAGVPYIKQKESANEYRQLAFSLMMQLSKNTEQMIPLA